MADQTSIRRLSHGDPEKRPPNSVPTAEVQNEPEQYAMEPKGKLARIYFAFERQMLQYNVEARGIHRIEEH